MSTDSRVFVVEITAIVNGSPVLHLFSTAPWATGPADTPPGKPVPSLLKSAGRLRRSLFGRGRVTGYIAPSYGNLVLANPTDATGKGVLDDWETYGVSGAPVIVRLGRIGDPYPSGWSEVYRARVQRVSFTSDAVPSVIVTLRDRAQALDVPLVREVFQGRGGTDGTTGLGQRKHFVSSDPGFIEPVLIDAQRSIYYVQGQGTFLPDLYLTQPITVEVKPFDAWDEGVELTRVQPNASSFDDLRNTAVSSGHVRYWFGSPSPGLPGYWTGPVYMRLGSPPAGDLRVYALGYPVSTADIASGYVRGSYNVTHLALKAGVALSEVSPDDQGVSVGSVLVDDDRTVLQVVSDACAALYGYCGFDRLERWRSGFLADPEDDGNTYGLQVPNLQPAPARPTVSRYTFTPDTYRDLTSELPSGMEAPVWEVQAASGRTWPSKVANGASALMRDMLTRQPYYEAWTSYSDATKRAHPQAETAEVRIEARNHQNQFSRELFGARYLWFFGGSPRAYTLTAPMTADTLALDLHDVVTLQTPRFGHGAGTKMRVTGIELDCDTRTMAFTLWVPGRGVYSGSTSALAAGSDAWEQAQATAALVGRIGLVRMPEFRLYSSGTISSPVNGGGLVRMPEFTLISGGTIAAVGGDPDFASVALLLMFNNSNGSTALTDSSSHADSKTITAGAAVSDATPKWGAGCLRTTWAMANIPTWTGSRFDRSSGQAYTIEGFARIPSTGTAAGVIFSLWGVIALDFGYSATDELSTSGPLTAAQHGDVTRDVWHFWQFRVAADNSWAMRFGGVLLASGSSAGTWTGTFQTAADAANDNTSASIDIDAIRVTQGVARSTSEPGSPWPTS